MVVRVIQIARLLIILASRHRSFAFENLAVPRQYSEKRWYRCALQHVDERVVRKSEPELSGRGPATQSQVHSGRASSFAEDGVSERRELSAIGREHRFTAHVFGGSLPDVKRAWVRG